MSRCNEFSLSDYFYQTAVLGVQMLPFGFDGDFSLEDTRGKVDSCQLKHY